MGYETKVYRDVKGRLYHNNKPVGWKHESERHAKAARGIKTNINIDNISNQIPNHFAKDIEKLDIILKNRQLPTDKITLGNEYNRSTFRLTYDVHIDNLKEEHRINSIDEIVHAWGEIQGYEIESDVSEANKPIWYIYIK